MSEERCVPFRENVFAYALGALDADDVPALESHIQTCEDCKAELAEGESIRTGLLQSIPPKMPPSRLRRKLAAQLPSARKRNFRLFGEFSLQQIVAAVAIIGLLGLNLVSNMQIRELRQQQNNLHERVSSGQEIIAMIADPETQVIQINADVENLTGSMLIDRGKNSGVLLLRNLPELEAGQTYQIWLFDAQGTRISVGIFIPASDQDYTTASLHSPASLEQFIGVGVTIEPSGGSEQPTGPRVLSAEL